MPELKPCSIHEATHIQVRGTIRPIAWIWGVGPGRALAKPSQGGFGCVLRNGKRISMWNAEAYFHRKGARLPARQGYLEEKTNG